MKRIFCKVLVVNSDPALSFFSCLDCKVHKLSSCSWLSQWAFKLCLALEEYFTTSRLKNPISSLLIRACVTLCRVECNQLFCTTCFQLMGVQTSRCRKIFSWHIQKYINNWSVFITAGSILCDSWNTVISPSRDQEITGKKSAPNSNPVKVLVACFHRKDSVKICPLQLFFFYHLPSTDGNFLCSDTSQIALMPLEDFKVKM